MAFKIGSIFRRGVATGGVRSAENALSSQGQQRLASGFTGATTRATGTYKTAGAARAVMQPKKPGLFSRLKNRVGAKPKGQSFGQMINSAPKPLAGGRKTFGQMINAKHRTATRAGFGSKIKPQSRPQPTFGQMIASKPKPLAAGQRTFGQAMNAKPRAPKFGSGAKYGFGRANTR